MFHCSEQFAEYCPWKFGTSEFKELGKAERIN